MNRVPRAATGWISLCVLVLLITPLSAQMPTPEQRVKGFVEALNSSDAERFAIFPRDNISAADRGS